MRGLRGREHSERGKGLGEEREAQGPSDAQGSPVSMAMPLPPQYAWGREARDLVSSSAPYLNG